MAKIAIVTDSTAALPQEFIDKYHISVAPLHLIWGDKTYLDGVSISPAEFYKKLPESKQFPSTSQATVGSFIDIFKRLSEGGYEILVIVISSKLSGTLDSATQAKEHFPDAKIELVDSLTTSVPLAMLVMLAARATKMGLSLEQVKALVERAVPRLHVFFAVDTLEYLHKGGRIGGGARFLGTALGLKPILELRDGRIEALERIRTLKKAHARLVELVETIVANGETVNSIGIIDADSKRGAENLLHELKKRYTPEEIVLGTLSPVIGAHTGPGTVGVAILTDLSEDHEKHV